MSKRKGGQAQGKYTLEFKMEAVRLVKGAQAVPVTAKILPVALHAGLRRRPCKTSNSLNLLDKSRFS